MRGVPSAVCEFLRYAIVGGMAFLADFGSLVLAQELFLRRFLCGVYVATVVGPHTENVRPVMSDLRAAGAIAEVRDAGELSRKVVELLADDGGLGARAAAAVERRRGVVAKCVAAMREALK